MRRILCVSIVAFLTSAAVLAQPAEKAAAATSGVVVLSPIVVAPPNRAVVTGFVNILSTQIKPPGGKDLFITVSAQTLALIVNINSSPTVTGTTVSEGAASIQLRVLLDGVAIPVGVPPAVATIISFDNQLRELVQVSTRDTLELVTEDGGAHSFSWIARDVGVGNHTITVQARFVISDAVAATAGSTAIAESEALIGPRTLTVEQVALDAR